MHETWMPFLKCSTCHSTEGRDSQRCFMETGHLVESTSWTWGGVQPRLFQHRVWTFSRWRLPPTWSTPDKGSLHLPHQSVHELLRAALETALREGGKNLCVVIEVRRVWREPSSTGLHAWGQSDVGGKFPVPWPKPEVHVKDPMLVTPERVLWSGGNMFQCDFIPFHFFL